MLLKLMTEIVTECITETVTEYVILYLLLIVLIGTTSWYSFIPLGKSQFYSYVHIVQEIYYEGSLGYKAILEDLERGIGKVRDQEIY